MLQELFPRRRRHLYYVVAFGGLLLVAAFFPPVKRGKKAVRMFEGALPAVQSANSDARRYNISLPPPANMSHGISPSTFHEPDYGLYAIQKDKRTDVSR
ncbi:MAG: hypothetical protein LBG65_08725 [Puniceicoccales bacterium]|jgi:hypothetical protein|nr:hypothetical protein [Puniceicoccales bacterium]